MNNMNKNIGHDAETKTGWVDTLGTKKMGVCINGKYKKMTLIEAFYYKSLETAGKAKEVYETSKETRFGAPQEKKGSVACREPELIARYKANRQADKAATLVALSKDWSTNMASNGSGLMKILDVKYVHENIMMEGETGNQPSRMLVKCLAMDGKIHQINIADEVHILVGNCSIFRANKLKEKFPKALMAIDGQFRIHDLIDWFEKAGLPVRKP